MAGVDDVCFGYSDGFPHTSLSLGVCDELSEICSCPSFSSSACGGAVCHCAPKCVSRPHFLFIAQQCAILCARVVVASVCIRCSVVCGTLSRLKTVGGDSVLGCGGAMLWTPWGLPLVVMSVLAMGFVSFVAYLRAPVKAVAIPIKGRHVVITGGSSGIGLEIGKLAAAEGARVSLVARDTRKLADAKEIVTQYCLQQRKGEGVPVQVNTYSADVKKFESVRGAIEDAVLDSGVIEVLVLSHGVSVVSTFEDHTLEDFDHVIDTNLKGNLHTIKAALPHIKASKGAPASISIFSSQAGQVGVYGYAAYSASKFALRGLAECLQQELIDRNIRLSLVYPPDTMTPGYVEDQKTMPEVTAKLSGSTTAMDAVRVARASLAGLKAGDFHIYCNLEGFALSILCSGMSPQPTLWKAMAEILIMGLLRVVALFIQKDWYDIILQTKLKESRAKKTQ